MLLKSKDIAYVSVMTAVSVLLLVISGYIESSTLFFLAAASFLTGVVENNYGIIPAIFHALCTVVLGLLLAPQKLYCITFLCFGIYVMLAEYIEVCRRRKKGKALIRFAWLIKGCVFQIMLAVILIMYEYIFGVSTLFSDAVLDITGSGLLFWCMLIAAGEVMWLLFDRAYVFFINKYGNMLRVKGN